MPRPRKGHDDREATIGAVLEAYVTVIGEHESAHDRQPETEALLTARW